MLLLKELKKQRYNLDFPRYQAMIMACHCLRSPSNSPLPQQSLPGRRKSKTAPGLLQVPWWGSGLRSMRQPTAGITQDGRGWGTCGALQMICPGGRFSDWCGWWQSTCQGNIRHPGPCQTVSGGSWRILKSGIQLRPPVGWAFGGSDGGGSWPTA